MTVLRPDDVDVVFFPDDGLPKHEQDDWTRIVAEAVKDDPGTLTVTICRSGEQWLVRGILWHPPGSTFFERATDSTSRPLRLRTVRALQSAGKPVRDERERREL